MNKLKIRKLGVLSVAKILAIIYLGISLIIAVPYGLVIIIFSLIGAGSARGDAAFMVGGGGVVMGIIVMIAIPIFYAIAGFIGGAIMALLYNLFAGIVGGIEIEVENSH
ncbi:MAG: hypothetical protein ACR2F2_12740 [Pyrinomonadaceae bacterium]